MHIMRKIFDYSYFILFSPLVLMWSVLGNLFGQKLPLLHVIVILNPTLRYGTDISKCLIRLASFLIRIGSNVNDQDCQGRTPLHYAVRMADYMPMANFLIEKGAILESKDKNNATPLLWASYYACYEAVELLILKGVDVNVQEDSYGNSALHEVARHWKNCRELTDITELLIISGSNIHALSKDRKTPLDIAILNKKSAVAKALKANVNNSEYYNDLANKKLSSGNIRGAEIDFTKAIVGNNTCATFFVNRSICRSFMQDHQRALDDTNIAIDLDPNFFGAWDRRGAVNLELGYIRESLKDLSKAIEINPDFAGSYYNRGIALARLGEKQAAISDLEKAVILYEKAGEIHFYQDSLKALSNLKAKYDDM
jgi:tetratricopeptide (TPR) repeat protein